MKLFIWTNPYDVDYGMSQYIAVAENIEAAKALVVGAQNNRFGSPQGTCEVKLDLGEPDAVLDVPCGRLDMWSE